MTHTPFDIPAQSRFKLGLRRIRASPRQRASEQEAVQKAREAVDRLELLKTYATSRLARAYLRLNLRRFTVLEDPAGPAIVCRFAFEGFLPRVPRRQTATNVEGESRMSRSYAHSQRL